MVRCRLDPENPPTLSEEDREAWERLKPMRDEDIDFSDIPDQAGKTGWRRARSSEAYHHPTHKFI